MHSLILTGLTGFSCNVRTLGSSHLGDGRATSHEPFRLFDELHHWWMRTSRADGFGLGLGRSISIEQGGGFGVTDDFAFHHIDDEFGNVRGVVSNPFDIFTDKRETNRS